MADKRRFNIKERKGIYTEGGGVKSSVKIVNGGLDFYFHFYFYFYFYFYFIFLFLEQLRLGSISHAVTSVTS